MFTTLPNAQKQEFGRQLSRRCLLFQADFSSQSRLNFEVNDTYILLSSCDPRVCPLFWSKKIKLKRLCDFMNTTKFFPAHTGANVLMSPKEPFFQG